jgi:hypothetical protein
MRYVFVKSLFDVKSLIRWIRQKCESAKLNSSGKVYLDALEKAAAQYGKEGLQHQVLYILTNGRWSNKADRKALQKFADTGITT